ncbi:unnamed protein product [Mycena citricolor]|uniref:ABC transporter domain-containing protein n=1 Tax=Mycena citricolor TaxID=2018698 RepID=A0AAD2H9X8_9AGAR|nr:unnamed protein product [Mycena citricolor]
MPMSNTSTTSLHEKSAARRAESLTHLPNSGSSRLDFRHLSFQVGVKGRESRFLVEDVSVSVRAGELLAVMGPSGAGKSTLLDLMAFRKPALEGASVREVAGSSPPAQQVDIHRRQISLNGEPLSATKMQKMSTFVEQEDALLGVLTVRESVTYALRLHLPLLGRRAVAERVDTVLAALGLQSCADQRIGTPISRGVSGGQKRRVTAACAMVTFPRILLLDEVTSGLDSTSAREVMSAIRTLAVSEGMIVIASVHQPSLETLAQFTDLLLLSEGKTCFLGKVDELAGFMQRWGHPVGRFMNPSDHAMNFLNNDFSDTDERRELGTDAHSFRQFYLSTSMHAGSNESGYESELHPLVGAAGEPEHGKAGVLATLLWNTLVLSERTAVNYSRNLLAYGVRMGMYAGMGVMLALIWIRLGTDDSKIDDRLSVHFYSVAFLAFMSVAGIPGFLEERAVYYRESKNGLYSTLPFVLSNTLVNIPFLFACAFLFTVICYWAIGLHSGAAAFFRFLGFLFLAIWAAESQVIIVASIIPIFVASLAIGAFINGFWMSVGGYFIKSRSLPRFWYYSFHFMDYQRYAFELLVNSDLRGLSFKCVTAGINGDCACAYPSSTPDTCTVSGQDVLNYLEIGSIGYGKWAGILIAITVIYRIALYFTLKMRTV